jgi:protein-tyrosine phosphatase
MRQVLFLCTANYYRSRFSELLFNALATQAPIGWVADSRGIATELGGGNVGPISPYAVAGLQARGIPVNGDHRWPRQVEDEHFAAADLVIALDEHEHRPFMTRKFPAWVDRIEYWHVGDLHIATVEEALPLAERNIHALIKRLASRG